MEDGTALYARNAKLSYALRVCWLIILVGFIAYKALEFLTRVHTFTVVVIGALLFAYLVYPVIGRLKRRMPLGAAIAIVYGSIALLVALLLYIVVPILSSDAQQLAHDAPRLVHNAQDVVTNSRNPLTARLPAPVREYLTTLPGQIQTSIDTYGSRVVSTVLPVLLSIVSIAALFIIVPVVAAYFMLEADAIRHVFLGFLPERARPKTVNIMNDLDHVVGGFIRGQLIVAAIVGTLVTVLLLALHVRYAALIGVIAGILDVIPYVGAVAGWLPAFFIALFTNGWQNAVFVTIGIIVINQLEGHFIAPNVVSKSVELTPLAVLLALLAGGELAGIPGLLLAVPIAGMIRVLILNLRPAYEPVRETQPAIRHASPE